MNLKNLQKKTYNKKGETVRTPELAFDFEDESRLSTKETSSGTMETGGQETAQAERKKRAVQE